MVFRLWLEGVRKKKEIISLGAWFMVAFVLIISIIRIHQHWWSLGDERGKEAPLSEGSFTMFAAGDIMLGRGVGKFLKNAGPEYPFQAMQALVRSADIAFANLESPLTPAGLLVHPKNRKIFSAKPNAVKGLTYAGFDVLSLANNHATDFGISSLHHTIKILAQSGIAHCGAGKTYEQAHQPVIKQVRGIRVAFLCYNEVPGSVKAIPGQGGVAWAEIPIAQADVRNIRKRADVVIVSMHMGKEYVDVPQGYYQKEFVKEFAHRVIDAGTDVVLGHHPHTPQGIDFYKGKMIAYSLGNFVFDQNEPWQHSIVLWLRLGRDGLLKAFQVIPIRIERYQPRPSTGADWLRMVEKMQTVSWSPLIFRQ